MDSKLQESFQTVNDFISEEFDFSDETLQEFVMIPLLIWGSMALYRFLRADFKDNEVNRLSSKVLDGIKKKEDTIKDIDRDKKKMSSEELNQKYKQRIKKLNREIMSNLDQFSEEFKRAQDEGKVRESARQKVLKFSKIVKEIIRDEERVLRKKGVMAYEDDELNDKIKNMSKRIKAVI